MEQARPDSTLLPAAQIEAEHGYDRSHDRDERITRLLTARPTTPLPEPGSEEAKAAFKAACREHTVRTQFANEYPELKRTGIEWWTASGLSKALETGELTPAECARLYPLATERELRMSVIEHELNLGGLFALAYAESYPVAISDADPDTTEEETGSDAELLRLGRQFEAASAREKAANEACNAAQDEADRHMPERPACLIYRASDATLAVHQERMMAEALSGRAIRSSDIEWLRRKMPMHHEVLRPIRPGERAHIDHPGRKFDIVPHPEAQARAEEIVAAWDAWQAERLQVLSEHCPDALEETANEAGDIAANLAHRIAALPALTAVGLRVKLRALAHYNASFFYLNLPELPDPDQALSHSLWRDVQAGSSEEASSVPDGSDTKTDPVPAAFDLGLDHSTRGTLTTDREWAVTQAAAIDLSSLTILELNSLYDRFAGVADGWLAVSSQPWARASADGQCHVSTAGGRIVDREQDRAGEIRNRIAEEMRLRAPADDLERNMRLETLIQFELLCEISLKHNPELRAEIAQAWGA